MLRFKVSLLRIMHDIRQGRHWEAYALFSVGLLIVALGLFGIVNDEIVESVSLLALSFLVFHTSVEAAGQGSAMNDILKDRQDFGSFSKLIEDARTLDFYGPTAVNILVNSADIRRFILERGGSVRVVVQDENSPAVEFTARQLDDSLDLAQTLRTSLAILGRLQEHPNFSYRKLAANPGFSLVLVNRARPDAYVIFESHGFRDENIADRMHIVIRRADSLTWYSYWENRFEAIWQASQSPSGLPDSAT